MTQTALQVNDNDVRAMNQLWGINLLHNIYPQLCKMCRRTAVNNNVQSEALNTCNCDQSSKAKQTPFMNLPWKSGPRIVVFMPRGAQAATTPKR